MYGAAAAEHNFASYATKEIFDETETGGECEYCRYDDGAIKTPSHICIYGPLLYCL